METEIYTCALISSSSNSHTGTNVATDDPSLILGTPMSSFVERVAQKESVAGCSSWLPGADMVQPVIQHRRFCSLRARVATGQGEESLTFYVWFWNSQLDTCRIPQERISDRGRTNALKLTFLGYWSGNSAYLHRPTQRYGDTLAPTLWRRTPRAPGETWVRL